MAANIGEVIGWKFNHAPGMVTRDGVIVEWPAALGPVPAAEQIEEWTGEYELAEARRRKIEAVNALRDERIAQGVPYSFPDGPGVIQTRDNTDLRNISAIATAGLALASRGETGAVLVFRDRDDVVHSLTPAQAVAMGLEVTNHIQEIYSASWEHKDAIESMEMAEEIEEYEIAAGWPAQGGVT